jgi:aspartate racemase
MKTLWIIWGLWPETTAQFYLKINTFCEQKYGHRRPNIIISNVPIPYVWEREAIMGGVGLERILPLLIQEAQRLERAWADYIVMPCNSLHIFHSIVQQNISIQFLHIVEVCCQYLQNQNYDTVWILSTSITQKSGLYARYLSDRNIEIIEPNADNQEILWKIIFDLVRGKKSSSQEMNIQCIIDQLLSQKAQVCLLACTDLQLITKNHHTVIDTMEIFAEAATDKMIY